MLSRIRDRLLPDSIVTRMTVVLFAGILLAQLLGAWLWTEQIKQSEHASISQIAANMGARIRQTIRFFSNLPDNYRHIVLNQLRDMGGTRHFVSVNEQLIPLTNIVKWSSLNWCAHSYKEHALNHNDLDKIDKRKVATKACDNSDKCVICAPVQHYG